MLLVISVSAAVLVLVLAIVILRWRSPQLSGEAGPSHGTGEAIPDETEIPYSTPATETICETYFQLAFSVRQFDYALFGEHAEVFERVNKALAATTPEQSYFPRRPMLLPRLMQALNDNEGARGTLVQMVMQDPALASGVLQRANNAFYRSSPQPVESIDRAVALLGTHGLRSLAATLILQPVFKLPPGYFDNFGTVTWEQGQRAGFSAQAIALETGGADPVVAQLLGLLSALSQIVLFRVVADEYRKMPYVLPRAEVFIRLMRAHSTQLSCDIASGWELSELSSAALQEQAAQCSPRAMSPLGRALYFGELCGSLAVLTGKRRYSDQGAHAVLAEQGLEPELIAKGWDAAQKLAPSVSSRSR